MYKNVNGNNGFRQTNAFAMQNGILLGLVALSGFAAFVCSFAYPLLSSLSLILILGSPVVAVSLTLCFRNAVAGKAGAFSYARGFSHTFLTILYASVWLAIGVFVYFAYLDKGFFLDSYVSVLQRPEIQEGLKSSPLWQQLPQHADGKELEEIVEMMRGISPASYSALMIYLGLAGGLPCAVAAGLICRRGSRKAL